MKRNSLKHLLLSLASKPFLCFSHERRFQIAKNFADAIEPVCRRFSLALPPPISLDNNRAYLWSTLFTSLTYRDIEFDPKVIVRDPPEIDSRGAIVISGHFYLNYFFLRWLHNEGHDLSSIMLTGTDEWRIMGTKIPLEVIKPDASCLIKVKQRVKFGGIVAVCIDHEYPKEHDKKINISHRDLYVSDRIIKFAERFDIPVIFSATLINKNGEIEVFTARPSLNETSKVVSEFTEFLESSIKRSLNPDKTD